MGLKDTFGKYKRGFQEMQKEARAKKNLAEAQRLQKLRERRLKEEAKAFRYKKMMEERTKIQKARATISKSRGQSGFVKAGNWLVGAGQTQKRAPVKRKKKPNIKYVIQGGKAYPVAISKATKKRTTKRKPKASRPSTMGNVVDDWNKLLR